MSQTPPDAAAEPPAITSLAGVPRDPDEALRAAEPAADAYRDLLKAHQLKTKALAQRDEVILRMRARGWRPPVIARALAAAARAAGLTAEEVARLGISEHNVRAVLRDHAAASGGGLPQD